MKTFVRLKKKSKFYLFFFCNNLVVCIVFTATYIQDSNFNYFLILSPIARYAGFKTFF